MEDKIDNDKAVGLVWYVACIIIAVSVWRSYNTLPAEFLLGALSAWCLRNGIFYYDRAFRKENE